MRRASERKGKKKRDALGAPLRVRCAINSAVSPPKGGGTSHTVAQFHFSLVTLELPLSVAETALVGSERQYFLLDGSRVTRPRSVSRRIA